MPPHLRDSGFAEQQLQMTLVDCPGHASLIRTIIGGAQIIDMVLLVVDANKGWQAQTTECLVLAELTSPHLVVALNKVDTFPQEERDERLQKVKMDIRRRLQTTRFKDAPLVGVAACVGGEKVAAVTNEEENPKENATTSPTPHGNFNMDTLVNILQEELPPPKRTREGPFYFSIDHCFPIRGQGTVLTGTVLSGSTKVNDIIEFPTLGMERKIKSMQMFRRKTLQISQGDRAGICVSNFDSKLLERGVAATPHAVQLLRGALALVRKVPYYKDTLKCGSKFHISVGHTTVMATVTFWGAQELLSTSSSSSSCATTTTTTATTTDMKPKDKQQQQQGKELVGHSSLGGDANMAGLPRLTFDYKQDFLQQDQLVERIQGNKNNSSESLLQWALLDFQTPVYCPLDSLVIGSRLDANDSNTSRGGGVNNTNTPTDALAGSASSCRLAFSGRLMEKVDPSKDASRVRLYTPKERRGVIRRLGDPHRRQDDGKIVRYEVFGTDLFKKETNMKLFVGMKLVTERGDIGVIKSSFGTSGKFRVYFPAGTDAREGDALLLQFKRYAHDPEKAMHQDMVLPASRPGSMLENNKGKKGKKPTDSAVTGKVHLLKGEVLENGKHNMAIVDGFFTPEMDIREKKGMKVIVVSTKEEGTIMGPFGKAGKCKVSFESGISAEIGAKAELHQ